MPGQGKTSTRRTLATLLVAAALLVAAPAAADRAEKGIGGIGANKAAKISGVFGNGERNGESGSSFALRMDARGLFMGSGVGNFGGLEATIEMGYDGLPMADDETLLGDVAFLADMSFGFPITMLVLERGEKSDPFLILSASPGAGLSMLHAYGYVQLHAWGRINPEYVVEASWRWWPDAASHAFGESDSINAASLIASVYKGKYGLFAEYHRSQRVSESTDPGDPTAFGGANPFPVMDRTAHAKYMRFGVGMTF